MGKKTKPLTLKQGTIRTPGLNLEKVHKTLCQMLAETSPDWQITVTEFKDLKVVPERRKNRARVVGMLSILLKCE